MVRLGHVLAFALLQGACCHLNRALAEARAQRQVPPPYLRGSSYAGTNALLSRAMTGLVPAGAMAPCEAFTAAELVEVLGALRDGGDEKCRCSSGLVTV